MDPRIIITLTKKKIADTIESVTNLEQFIRSDRPIPEQLHHVDQALVHLHDARTELASLRAQLYAETQEKKEAEGEQPPAAAI